jgi:cytochrome c oxidase assembly protein subunit 11
MSRLALQAVGCRAGRHVALEFMSMLPPGSEFELMPETHSMSCMPGRLYEAKFLVRSKASLPVTGQAVPSVAPVTTADTCRRPSASASRRNGSRRPNKGRFTVRFIIDPQLPREVDRMTLAYRCIRCRPSTTLAAR